MHSNGHMAAVCRCQTGWDIAPGSNTIEGCPEVKYGIQELFVYRAIGERTQFVCRLKESRADQVQW